MNPNNLDKICLIINNESVSKRQLLQEYNQIKKTLEKDGKLGHPSDEVSDDVDRWMWLSAKKNIIQRVLLEQEASRIKHEVTFSEIKVIYDEMIQHYGGEEAFYQKIIPSKGAKKDRLQMIRKERQRILEGIEKSIKVDILLKLWEKELPPMLEEDFEEFYEKNKDLYAVGVRDIFSYLCLMFNDGHITHSENSSSISKSNSQISHPAKTTATPLPKEGNLSTLESKLLEICQTTEDFLEKCKKTSEMFGMSIKKKELTFLYKHNVLTERETKTKLFGNEIGKILLDTPTNQGKSIETILDDQNNLKKGFLWVQKHATLPPGTWEYEHVKDRVKKDAMTMRSSQLTSQRLEQIKKTVQIQNLEQ